MQTESMFGTKAEGLLLMQKRSRESMFWKVIFIFATAVAVLFLLLLLVSVIDSIFGYTVIRNEVDVPELVGEASSLEELSRSQLEETAKNNLSSGILRRVEYEKPIAERSDRELRALIEQYVIKPSVLRSWGGLWDSITKQDEIGTFMANQEDSYLIFKSWISLISLPMTRVQIPPSMLGFVPHSWVRSGLLPLPSCWLSLLGGWDRPSI